MHIWGNGQHSRRSVGCVFVYGESAASKSQNCCCVGACCGAYNIQQPYSHSSVRRWAGPGNAVNIVSTKGNTEVSVVSSGNSAEIS